MGEPGDQRPPVVRSLRDRLVGAAQGYLQGVSLYTVLQLIGLEEITCSLSVRSGELAGRLDFRSGELVDARSGDLQGTEAAYEILGWKEPSMEIGSLVASRVRNIRRPLAAILLDASRLADEGQPMWPSSRPDLVVVGTEEEAVAEEGEQMNRLQEILDALRDEVPEFVSTDVVNIESGLSIGGGSVDPEFDSSLASATSAEVVKANRNALELLGFGADSTEDILISTAKVYLLIRMLGTEYYQVLAVRRKGNLGLARAIMKKHGPRLLRAIGELT